MPALTPNHNQQGFSSPSEIFETHCQHRVAGHPARKPRDTRVKRREVRQWPQDVSFPRKCYRPADNKLPRPLIHIRRRALKAVTGKANISCFLPRAGHRDTYQTTHVNATIALRRRQFASVNVAAQAGAVAPQAGAVALQIGAVALQIGAVAPQVRAVAAQAGAVAAQAGAVAAQIGAVALQIGAVALQIGAVAPQVGAAAAQAGAVAAQA